MARFYKTLATVVFLFFLPINNSFGTELPKQQDSFTKPLMTQFLKELTALKKYFGSEEKFTDPRNAQEITRHLREFAKLAKLARHDPQLQKDNYKFSQKVLENYIVDTERLFRVGNKSFARWQLGSTISVCMTCHNQLPSSNRAFNDFLKPNVFNSKFDQAEFLFATRSFDPATDIYDQIINEFPDNKYEPREVETAFERELVYYLRLKRNPKAAIEKFKTQLQNKRLPFYVRENVVEWISNLEKMQKEPTIDPQSVSDEKIVNFAKATLDTNALSKLNSSTDPNLVTYIHASGVLYEYLQKHPESKVVPDILYYLSICDRNIGNTFFYSLADLYLRECITKYPHLPIAQKCYREYEMETILGYTGSSGTNVPVDVKSDLKNLKKLIDTGGRVNLLEH